MGNNLSYPEDSRRQPVETTIRRRVRRPSNCRTIPATEVKKYDSDVLVNSVALHLNRGEIMKTDATQGATMGMGTNPPA
jgi:hypothetical protein